MRCLHLIISGRVQGVWFRESMRQEALSVGATGWVRNLPDGRVEAMVCGNEITLESMLKWARRGSPLAQVAGIEMSEAPSKPYSSFEKRN